MMENSHSTWHCIRCDTITKPGDRLCSLCRTAKDAARTAQEPGAPRRLLHDADRQALPALPVQTPGAAQKRVPRIIRRRSAKEWAQIRECYVTGPDGFKVLARWEGVSLRQLKRRAAAEGWSKLRAEFHVAVRRHIESDEPGWTFKASDPGATTAIRAWANRGELHGGGGAPARVEAARSAAEAMDQWRSQQKARR